MKPPQTIYLIPDHEYGYVWCEDPDPGIGMEKKDAIKYIRADIIKVGEECPLCHEVRGFTPNYFRVGKPLNQQIGDE